MKFKVDVRIPREAIDAKTSPEFHKNRAKYEVIVKMAEKMLDVYPPEFEETKDNIEFHESFHIIPDKVLRKLPEQYQRKFAEVASLIDQPLSL